MEIPTRSVRVSKSMSSSLSSKNSRSTSCGVSPARVAIYSDSMTRRRFTFLPSTLPMHGWTRGTFMERGFQALFVPRTPWMRWTGHRTGRNRKGSARSPRP